MKGATIRLCWHSNSPWAGTGYGQQTALFLPRLKEHYDLVCSTYYGLEASVLPWKGIPILPGIGLTHGDETILDHAGMYFEDLRGGLVVTLMDVWVLNPSIWQQVNHAAWCPVDHEPVPRPVSNFFHESGSVPIAMSRFGEGQLREAGLDPLYVPHAVDCSLYKQVPKATARERTKMPQDAFVVGMVAANKGNPSRKCFVEAFQAFKAFHDNHPDALLYLHTEATGKFDGVNLPELAHDTGVPPGATLFADQYRVVHYPFEHEVMANVYSSLDVLLMPSAGEGFGIPAVEAQACGVPVIASDFSAQPETVGSGWLVKGTKTYTPIKSWQFRPDVEDIIESLKAAYGMSKAGREEAARKGRKHAEQYHVDHVFEEFMLPALQQAAERFDARQPQVFKPKAKVAA